MFDEILLTGFKVFGNHDVNPTQLISEHFSAHPLKGVNCSVVEVTAKDADAYVEKVKEHVICSKDKKILNLHFGVGPNKVYYLEQSCYNNKDFSIPDNQGYQPRKEQICKNEPIDYQIHTKLDLNSLLGALSKEFPVQLSSNPGRYLCNYIYFKSAHDLSMHNEHCYSLFVHFPTLDISPHQNNIRFVEKIFEILLKKEIKQ